jgi:RNA polymerase sigma-B factor
MSPPRDDEVTRPSPAPPSPSRDEVVVRYLPLARHLVRLFENRGESVDDLMQVASIGLLRAADRFDPSLGFEFSTFASETVLGELKRHLRDRAWSVKTPRALQERYLEVSTTIELLRHKEGRSPSVPEVAAEGGWSVVEVLAALEAGRGYRTASLDAGAVDVQPHAGTEPDASITLADREELGYYLSRLPGREREVLELRFVDELSQVQIAERLGISQMHVSRLLRHALATLRSLYGIDDPGGAGSDATE